MTSACEYCASSNQSDYDDLLKTIATAKTLIDVIADPTKDKQHAKVDFLFINADTYNIVLQCMVGVFLTISFVGTFCNGLSILIFIKMGMGDGVTISFLALSISDMIILSFAFLHACSMVVRILEAQCGLWFYVQPILVSFFCAHIRELFNINTTVITTFLAIQRCFCVAKPLHFKGAFTRSRAVYTLCFTALFSLFCYMPVLSLHRTALRENQLFNKTQLVLSFAEGRDLAVDLNEIVAGIFIPCFTQIVILICLLVMAKGLKKSVEFRNRSTFNEQSIGHIRKVEISKTKDKEKNVGVNMGKSMDNNQAKMNKKESNVLMQVLLICLIFVICNIPKIGIALVRLFILGFDHGGSLQFVYLTVKLLRTPFELINSTVNIFIYYKYNSKFRSILYNTFGRRRIVDKIKDNSMVLY